jgi:hypothetical protein
MKAEKNMTSAAKKIQFWYRGRPKYYVRKSMNAGTSLTNEAIVSEHIASCFYRLLNNITPDTHIIQIESGYALVSKVLPGYQDLKDWLKIENYTDVGKDTDPIVLIDGKATQEERKACFERLLGDKKIKGSAKANLLVAAILLQDADVLGRNLTNIGLIKQTSQHCLVKIDPGGANLKIDKDFKDNLSRDEPVIDKNFSCEIINQPTIMGNHHFVEFFSSIPKKVMIQAIIHLSNVSDAEIKKHVERSEYRKLVSDTFLEAISTTLCQRKKALCSLLTEKELAGTKEFPPITMSPQTIFIDNSQYQFQETGEKIDRGNAKPVVTTRTFSCS